ncbi:Asp23/Gls24 family envelope stress response protein [Streptomyces sp. L2]|uniref:Asp23/Gls24 family envelope stress response protein n=1 Tax=Streptomyces sp. L2 TaxID=2162665 RepID=UPI00101261B3|nr:Asp23/Gls24 family envelope stress response protein [Streptomyces sp. L2]
MAMNVEPNHGSAEGTDDSERSDDERLACGRELADVWRQWEEGPDDDPHARTCPHCLAALHELDQLKDAVRQTRLEEPEADAGPLVERVMEVVRLELRPGRTLPLGTPAEDHWIVEAAAAKVFRGAVDALPGVRAGSCRVVPAGQGAASQRTRGPVTVNIEIVVGVTADLQRAADQVRETVLNAAERALGMEVGSVDVAVADVYDDAVGGSR